MAGILTPFHADALVSALVQKVQIPIEVHTHATSGVGEMTLLKSVEAGASYIDTAISTLAGGTSQPACEPLHITLTEMGYDTGLDLTKLQEIADYFKPIKEEFRAQGILDAKVMEVDPNALIYQVPGGMLSNLLSQLKEAKQAEKYEEVLREVPRVRAELGYPPLVTPMSQMVGTQAVMNVLSGERYKMIPNEIKEYVKGYYGKTPAPISAEMQHLIIGDEVVITKRPADLLDPAMETLTAEIGDIAKSTEDVLLYAMFPTLAKPFMQKRNDPFFDIPIQTVQLIIE